MPRNVSMLLISALACWLTAMAESGQASAGEASRLAAAGLESAARYSESHGGQATVVLSGGQTIFEHYAYGGSVGQPLGLSSGSKSFVGIAAIAAVQDGLIRLDDRAADAISQWNDDPLKRLITYRQLLNMTSGLSRTTTGQGPTAPAWNEQADKPMAAKPGARFEYGAFQQNVFALALEHKLDGESFEDYLQRRILDPLEIKVEWRLRCSDGRPWTGGGAFMTARDWATFGEFVRRQGNSSGKQIIDAKRFPECFRGTAENPAYGLTWWLKSPVRAELVSQIPLLSEEWAAVANCDWLPGDLVAAFGGGKQRLYVIPSMKLVIVRLGSNSHGFSEVEFLSRLLRGGRAADPTPSKSEALPAAVTNTISVPAH